MVKATQLAESYRKILLVIAISARRNFLCAFQSVEADALSVANNLNLFVDEVLNIESGLAFLV